MDQFTCKTPGRLPNDYGREGQVNQYHGKTIFNDSVSGTIWVKNQDFLGSGETIESNLCFKQWLRELAWIEVKNYHSDNGVFTTNRFREQCKLQDQTQSFSGVGAQHMNACSEHSIGIIMGMAHTFMIHVALN